MPRSKRIQPVRLPGFCAEASLYRSKRQYRSASLPGSPGSGGAEPAALPLPPWLLAPLGVPEGVTVGGTAYYSIFGVEVFAGAGWFVLALPVAAAGTIAYQISHYNPPLPKGSVVGGMHPPCKGTGAEKAPGTATGWSISGDAAAYLDAYNDAERQCQARSSACIGTKNCPTGTNCLPVLIPGKETYSSASHLWLWTTCTLPFTCECHCL
jgi:hypothetical protein